jgi:cytochrome oxidase Cu insertion factor (SCO1/SenC/PrrC family)
MSPPVPSSRSRRLAGGRSPRSVAAALLASVVVVAATAAPAQTLLPPDPTVTVGRVIPLDGFADESGRSLSALLPRAALERDPRPWIVSPMYTRCPHTCSAVTTGLRRALDRSGLAPSEYRVVSFSFDPDETDAGLREFRARMRLPADWLTLRARSPEALARTLAALDFHTIAMDGGDFDHPNLVAVLAPDRRLAGYLFGIDFSGATLARMVRGARGGVSAIDAARPHLFLVAVVGFVASGAAFMLLLARRRARRGGDGAVPASAGRL